MERLPRRTASPGNRIDPDTWCDRHNRKVFVCGYSVMSNHLHLVLRNRPDIAEQWSADEIALRWCRVFPPRDDATGEPIEHDLAMLTANSERLSELRKRLANLSWFMKCLCEKIARASNHEDGSSGRFWASRFRSVALLDEAAILACSVYVDLNPIRRFCMSFRLVEDSRESGELLARRGVGCEDAMSGRLHSASWLVW
jgi:hypothetical protein